MPDPAGAFIRSATSTPTRSSRPFTGTPTAFSDFACRRIDPSGAAETSACIANGTDTPFFSVPRTCSAPFSMLTVTSWTGAAPDPSARVISAVSDAVSMARSAARIRSVYDFGSSKIGGAPRAWLMNSPSSERTASTTSSARCSRTLRISTPHRTGPGSCAAPPVPEASAIAPMSETVVRRGQAMTSSLAGSAAAGARVRHGLASTLFQE